MSAHLVSFLFFFEKRQGQQLIKGKRREKNKAWETRKLIFYTEPLRTC